MTKTPGKGSKLLANDRGAGATAAVNGSQNLGLQILDFQKNGTAIDHTALHDCPTDRSWARRYVRF